ncbi:MAG: amidase, partial [Rhodoferax sp.]|nr:amidase [Rhodoferax sp.]
MSSLPLHDWGAQALLQAYHDGSVSPVEVTRSVLAHIERWEPHLCASYLLRPDLALQQARESEARWRRGAPAGVLDGIPVTIKDNIATAGDPVPLGSRCTDHTPAPADAPPSARLRESGAVLVCKTTMPDYGMLSSGLST